MKNFIKNHPDAFASLVLLIILPIVAAVCFSEGMRFSGNIVMWTHVVIFLYFIIWVAFIRNKRNARRIMSRNVSSDPFGENDYYNRTGISGHRQSWRSRPWPRPQDQWDIRRNMWDTEE